MVNPASSFCASKTGGTSQILTGPGGGQTGFCSFGGPSASSEEWTLFRAGSPAGAPGSATGVAVPPPQAAVVAFLAAGGLGSAPATGSVCAAAGAVAAEYKCAPPLCALGSPLLTVCTFPDGSSIAAQTLAAGPAGSPQLAAALK